MFSSLPYNPNVLCRSMRPQYRHHIPAALERLAPKRSSSHNSSSTAWMLRCGCISLWDERPKEGRTGEWKDLRADRCTSNHPHEPDQRLELEQVCACACVTVPAHKPARLLTCAL